VALLALALGFGFSGYLLPWNTISYFATKVGTDMAGSVPWPGRRWRGFLRAGHVGGATLPFLRLHVAVLPGGGHRADRPAPDAGVQRHGDQQPAVDREKRFAATGGRFRRCGSFPTSSCADDAWYAAAGRCLECLAALFRGNWGDKADPFASAPAGITDAEWYFLRRVYTLKLIPSHVGFMEGELLGLAGLAAGDGIGAAAFWRPNRAAPRRTAAVTGAGVLVVAYLATFSLLGI